ncbi:MAG: hypothetical protein AAF226_06955, partial [Verrucomicrobiota bacterium]
LRDLDLWRPTRVGDAINAWVGCESFVTDSGSQVGEYLASLSDDQIQDVLQSLSYWVQVWARLDPISVSGLLCLIERVLLLSEGGTHLSGDVVAEAINHPVGHATKALICLWDIHQDSGEGKAVKRLMTDLCNPKIDKYLYARVVLSESLLAFFFRDQDWTLDHMLPLFDWGSSETEAFCAWCGFLGNPRHSSDLFTHLREAFFETQLRLDLFEEGHKEQFVRLLTSVALYHRELLSLQECQRMFAALAPCQLITSAYTLSHAMEGAGDKGAEFWHDLWLPFFTDIWPKDQEKLTPDIGEQFASVCIDSHSAFPVAVEALHDYILPVRRSYCTCSDLIEKNHHTIYPQASLSLVSRLFGDELDYPVSDLQTILDGIAEADPTLRETRPYRKLGQLLDQSPYSQ